MKLAEKKKLLIILITTFSILLLDQIIKFFIETTIQLNQSIPVIKSIFHITLIHNFGAGFGLFQGSAQLLIWFTVIFIGVILYLYDKIPEKSSIQIFVALILGGTLGNLIDRLRLGYVIDFLDFRIWPAFNLADAAITIGVIGLVVYLIRKK